MMNNNGGFQPFYPSNQNEGNQQYNNPNGYNTNSFHRSNTFMPQNPYQNTNNMPHQPMPPQQNLNHSNTYMNQQPPLYPQPQSMPQNPYMPPPPQQGNQMQPQNPYMPPPQPQGNQTQPQNPYVPPPPPQGNQMQPQNQYFQRSNTYIPPPSPYQNPPPMQLPQSQQGQQFLPPPQSPYPAPLPHLQRANTYCPPAPKRQTIYDTLDVRPHRFAPDNSMRNNQFRQSNCNNFNNNLGNSSYFNEFPGASNFNAEADCQVIRNAVHGWGTDERAIINVIVNRNSVQRAEIRRVYKACFGKDLIKRLKEDTSGNFKDIICAMFMTPAEYDAYCLYKAMKGLGTNEGVLIEIIGTRNCQQLQEIKDIFEKEYKNSLENWVKGDTSGNFRLLLVALLQCNRSNNPNPDINQCQADAQALYNAGEGRWGTDEATFIRIFANRSAAEIACINQCYLKMKGKGLLHAIDKEFSGDIRKLLQTIVGGLLDIHGYFAMRIRESVKGLGTNDAKLVRVIVSRCEIDLPQIKQAYQRIYQRDLLRDVIGDTSGYYRDILKSLISRC